MLADRDYQLDRMRHELDAARKTEGDLRAELSTTGSRSSGAVDRFRTDISQLEAQLAAAIEERAKLQREIGTMKRDAESTWAAERVENALLRERINDVAAEVARLTATLEGPGSPIESLLAEAGSAGRAAANRSGEPAAGHRRQRREQEHARRPHPRAANDRLAGGVELALHSWPVMPAHSRSENGVASLAYVAGRHP